MQIKSYTGVGIKVLIIGYLSAGSVYIKWKLDIKKVINTVVLGRVKKLVKNNYFVP